MNVMLKRVVPFVRYRNIELLSIFHALPRKVCAVDFPTNHNFHPNTHDNSSMLLWYRTLLNPSSPSPLRGACTAAGTHAHSLTDPSIPTWRTTAYACLVSRDTMLCIVGAKAIFDGMSHPSAGIIGGCACGVWCMVGPQLPPVPDRRIACAYVEGKAIKFVRIVFTNYPPLSNRYFNPTVGPSHLRHCSHPQGAETGSALEKRHWGPTRHHHPIWYHLGLAYLHQVVLYTQSHSFFAQIRIALHVRESPPPSISSTDDR